MKKEEISDLVRELLCYLEKDQKEDFFKALHQFAKETNKNPEDIMYDVSKIAVDIGFLGFSIKEENKVSYWVDVVEASREHREIESMSMSISYNYTDLMIHLPCGRVIDWRGKKAIDMIPLLESSLAELVKHRVYYLQFECDPARNLGTVKNLLEILDNALQLFKKYPKAIVDVN